MDIFSLNNELIHQYEAFARSFTRVKSPELKSKVDTLYAERKFWPEPLIQINPHYESGGSISDLVTTDGLEPECAEIFPDLSAMGGTKDKSLKLRRHQQQAISLALDGKSFVVTTGTGSGKSLCFFIPIVDAILKAKKAGEQSSTRAIIIYPMNALANSQLEELKKFLTTTNPSATSVTFARYTGQESQEERERIQNDPPDILLTNFMMLELLMTRQHKLDQDVIANCEGLKFIVLDELHTYRGRQGADVAMLMRRLRARVGNPACPPLCIGTSATMASEEQTGDREQVVADIATRLFGTEISRDAIVTETLKRATDPHRSADQGLHDLGKAVSQAAEENAYHSKTNAEIRNDPLAIWVETRLGLADLERKPKRAKPISVSEAAERLSEESERETTLCQKALQNALLAFSFSEKTRGVTNGNDDPLFAFKLHQFISGAGRVYITLDEEGERTVTFDGQRYDPTNEEKLLYATHFCRRCGQEHHPVTLRENNGGSRIERREIDDIPAGEDEEIDGSSGRWGFLMPEPNDDDFNFSGRDEDYPDLWLEEKKSGEIRLKSSYRKTRVESICVLPNGEVTGYGRRAWFMPGRFKFCPACRDFHSDSTRDINRLASLSAEGRSSATTVLISTILRWMSNGEAEVEEHTRKLLAFTDNRQDAALQAGHFNDFVFVTLLRGAILAALSQAKDGTFDESEIGAAVQKTLGFLGINKGRRTEWLIEPQLKGANLITAERSLRDTLTHRFWVDQRRGWRYTNPNLEQLGLIEARYVSLDEMAADTEEFESCPILHRATTDERVKIAIALFDHMRKGLAVECDALDRQKTESLAKRMGAIKSPWRLEEENIGGVTTFMTKAPPSKTIKLGDEALILRGSPQSAIGRKIRNMSFGGQKPSNQKEVIDVIDGLLKTAINYGLIIPATSAVGGDGYRLLASSVAFGLNTGTTEPERDNPFFKKLYQGIADILNDGGTALFGFEGREHTAQVESDLRELREARFRYSEEDQKTLSNKADRLKDLKEDPRFLPTLFCSPTMELGVDISSMSVVYMRNTPPTPANYAQRSGRAGRSGQAALVVTYCAAQSPHDQYYFQNPKAMVDGVVRPPSIDLTNHDLIESHLHAEWLAASGVALSKSIADNLDMGIDKKPLGKDHWEKALSEDARINGERQISKVLEALSIDFGEQKPHWFTNTTDYARTIANAAPERLNMTFDRWRDLLTAAERQVADATKTLDDYSISPQERKAAEFRVISGNTQRKLLLGSSDTQGSDFYVYRYLATEGFLPGYNFPRLPLMAFVPGGQGGKGQRYIQRARFLAISEFGPQSLVYHEGRAYRVDRALLKETGSGPEGHLPTFSTSVCPSCGASHDGEPPENCTVCGHSLGASDITRQLYRIENVGTRPTERITANDEDRRRQGFELQTTFSFEDRKSVIKRSVHDDEGELLQISFAPAALVRRINRGLRRRKDENEIGFMIDPKSGRWLGADKQEDKEQSPTNIRQRITPVVEDRKNTMLIRFPGLASHLKEVELSKALVTLQHAFARGIEQVYQLEEGEILVEPTPNRKNRRSLLLYEAAEGGAGALSRLIGTEFGLRRVAQEALSIMHYDLGGLKNGSENLADVPDTQCVAGCYRCLLSYFNQPDQEHIDRRNPDALKFLTRLALTQIQKDAPTSHAGSILKDCPPPDVSPLEIDGHSLPLIWRSARIVAVEKQDVASGLADQLAEKGIELISLPSEEPARSVTVAELSSMLGGVQ